MKSHPLLPSWTLIAAYGALTAWAYRDVLTWLVQKDWVREDYSHCYLVPFAASYLLWERWSALGALPSRRTWSGLSCVAAAIACFWLGELAGEFFMLYLSLWLWTAGLCWIHLGWSKLRRIGLPLLLLLTLFPLPHFVNNQVTVKLKLLSSQLGVHLLRLYGMTAYREGNVIDIGYTQLQVVDACSGLRYLIPLLVLGLVLAAWLKGPQWKRVVLVVSAVPLAIAVNALRIALTGILYADFGDSVADGFFHGFSGWLIFLCTTAFLGIEMLVLSRIPTRFARGFPHPAPPAAWTGARPDAGLEPPTRDRSPWRHPASAIAVLLLSGSAWLAQGLDFREKVPTRKPLDLFPTTLGEWTGTWIPLEPETLRELDLTAYLFVDYAAPGGEVVNCYAAYYASQRKGESIHSPATCMPGDGWVFSESGEAWIHPAESDGRPFRVRRALMHKDLSSQLVYFWFPMRGRIATDALQLKVLNFWDALTRHRTDGALVRLVTPVYEDESPEQAEARLQGFARQFVPVLDTFLPTQ